MRDIRDTRLLFAKFMLFVLLGSFAAALLLARTPQILSALLLVLCVWAFARAYYFCFYVIGRYMDPSFRYSGLGSALRAAWKLGREKPQTRG